MANTNPFHDTTKRIRVIKGRVHGIQVRAAWRWVPPASNDTAASLLFTKA